MELDLARFDLPHALDNAMTLVRERAAAPRPHASSSRSTPARRLVAADERKVKQIAAQPAVQRRQVHARRAARSTLRARLDARRAVEIAVIDTGVGIAPDEQAQVFEEFRQAAAATTRARPRAPGLGLALARRFVELHGGTIRVESAPGAGSTFTFAHARRDRQERVARASRILDRRGQREEHEARCATSSTTTGYRDARGGDRRGGRAPGAREHRPDLVLMDIQLPGIDGIEALRQLRARPATPAHSR